MTTIPQIAAAMHHVLTTVADRAGRLSRMVERSDAKLTGSIFTQTLVFGLGANPHASLSTLTQTTADLGVRISVEALHQRFDREAALCLEQVLYAAVRQVVAADPVVLPVLDRFPAVVVQDSTTIILPEVLAPIWTGCGGAPHAGNAALKLQLALDLCTGRLLGPQLHNGRESDRNATLDRDLPPGAVRIVDLARDTGAKGVKVRPNGFPKEVPEEKTLEQIGRSLHELGDFARSHGQVIRLEVHGTGTSFPPNIRKILDVADHPSVGACWNSNASDLAGKGWDYNFDLLKDKIFSVHMTDLFSEGYPYRKLLTRLNESGYTGFCLAEIQPSTDPVRVMKYYRGLWLAYQGLL